MAESKLKFGLAGPKLSDVHTRTGSVSPHLDQGLSSKILPCQTLRPNPDLLCPLHLHTQASVSPPVEQGTGLGEHLDPSQTLTTAIQDRNTSLLPRVPSQASVLVGAFLSSCGNRGGFQQIHSISLADFQGARENDGGHTWAPSGPSPTHLSAPFRPLPFWGPYLGLFWTSITF